MAEPLEPEPNEPAGPAEPTTLADDTPLIYGPSHLTEPPAMSTYPSIRQALTAEIDWDEVGSPADDWVAPSVPPLGTAESMSHVASVALFGHA
jgi:hypothetical protein